MRNKAGLYKVTGVTQEGWQVTAYAYSNYPFGAVFQAEKDLGIVFKGASPSKYPVEFDVWQDDSVTKS